MVNSIFLMQKMGINFLWMSNVLLTHNPILIHSAQFVLIAAIAVRPKSHRQKETRSARNCEMVQQFERVRIHRT
jgi:hypothetical protein